MKLNLFATFITFLISMNIYFIFKDIIVLRQEKIIHNIFSEYEIQKRKEAYVILNNHEFACKMNIHELTNLLIYIDNLCKKYSIDYKYVKAIISYESRWNHTVIGGTNAYGLMQITPIGAKSVKRKHGNKQFNPFYNVETGIQMLKMLYNKTGSMETTLIAYNAGLGNVKKYGDKLVKNNQYVKNIKKWLDFFKNT